MIDRITTSYEKDGVEVSLSVKRDYDESCINPYGLAKMFSRIVADIDFDPSIFIDQLKEDFAEQLEEREEKE